VSGAGAQLQRHRCPECGEPDVHARGAGGEVFVLDPRIPVAAVYVRGAFDAEAWRTTEAMPFHASVCTARAARRQLGGADVMAEAAS
jgi:hypothetical protein